MEEENNNLPIDKKIQKVEFDLPQLKKDVDRMFQKELEKSNKSLTATVDKNVETYEKRVGVILARIKEDLIAQVISRNNITINTNDGNPPLTLTTAHTDHPKTESVLHSLMHTRKALLVGPTGTGKTTMIEKIAAQLKIGFHKYSCSRDSSVHDLLGYKQPRSEEYLETTFLKCYEEGGIFLVDEYDAMSGDMALFFNGVADNSKFISVPHRDTKPIATKHKDFYLIMCGNTYGKGSVEYSGRDFQDLALMDRFRLCRHHIGYNINLEKAFMGNNYNWALKLRKSLEKHGSYLSTRSFEEINKLLSNGMNTRYVIEMLISDMEEPDQKAIRKEMEPTQAGTYSGRPRSSSSGINEETYRRAQQSAQSIMSNRPSRRNNSDTDWN